MEKPTIFNYGGCDLWTALKDKRILRDFKLEPISIHKTRSFDFSTCFYPIQSPSIISLYTDPGSVASSLIDDVSLRENPTDDVYHIYNEVVKFPYLDYWKKNVGKDDFLVLNFSSEFYNRFDTSKEYFTLIPQFHNLREDEWVKKEILQKTKFHIEFNAREIHDRSRDYLRDFAKQVYDIFKNRVIITRTRFTDRIIVNKNLEVKKLQDEMLNISYFSAHKFKVNHESLDYAQSFADLIVKFFRHVYKTDIPLVDIPSEFVFMDLYHPYGVTPFHLHSVSNNLISGAILEEIKAIQTKNFLSERNETSRS